MLSIKSFYLINKIPSIVCSRQFGILTFTHLNCSTVIQIFFFLRSWRRTRIKTVCTYQRTDQQQKLSAYLRDLFNMNMESDEVEACSSTSEISESFNVPGTSSYFCRIEDDLNERRQARDKLDMLLAQKVRIFFFRTACLFNCLYFRQVMLVKS